MLLFVLYPNNWGQSTMLSSEIPSTCLAVAATYLVVSRQSARWLVVSGVLLAFANWIRPTAAIFLGSVIVFLLLFRRQRWLLSIASLLGGYIVTILVIGSMCYMRTGHFLYQARNYWFSMVDECYDGAETGPHWNQPIWPVGFPRYIENHEQMDCFEFERIWRERSLSWLKDHKTDYLRKIPGRVYYMYQSDIDNMVAFLADKSDAEQNYITLPYKNLLSEIDTLSEAQRLTLLTFVLYLLLLLAAAAGTLSAFRQRRYKSLFLPLFIVAGGTLALVLVMHGETRFKDPLMPYLFMLASYSFTK
jgi:4-amino-4-deoxy-L-arabinose transferase-like glycosyltransferase